MEEKYGLRYFHRARSGPKSSLLAPGTRNLRAAPGKIKIFFILGESRSGSTILEKFLAQTPGFHAVGELYRVFKCGLLDNWLCGCGTPFVACDFWQKVFGLAVGGMSSVDAQRLERLRLSLFHSKHIRLRELTGLGRLKCLEECEEYSSLIIKLLAAVHDTSGCRVIVDSSKSAFYARQ